MVTFSTAATDDKEYFPSVFRTDISYQFAFNVLNIRSKIKVKEFQRKG